MIIFMSYSRRDQKKVEVGERITVLEPAGQKVDQRPNTDKLQGGGGGGDLRG